MNSIIVYKTFNSYGEFGKWYLDNYTRDIDIKEATILK